MANCEVKSLFNLEKHQFALESKLYDIKNQVKGLNKITEKEYYDLILSSLRDQNTPFILEYSNPNNNKTYSKHYKESYIELVKLIKQHLSKESDSLKKDSGLDAIKISAFFDESNFQEDVNASKLRIDYSQVPDYFEINSKEAADKEVTFESFLSDVYGHNDGVKYSLKSKFGGEIFRSILFDFDNGTIVSTDQQLNQNLISYKEYKLQQIVDFLEKEYPERSYSSEIYNGPHVNSSYYEILSDMKDYLNSIDNLQEEIDRAYSSEVFGQTSEFLEILHAYTILTYFDDLIVDKLGRIINYDKIYKNTETPQYLLKYHFSVDSSHQRKAWNDSDDRTAVQNTSRYSKFVIESIPLISSKKTLSLSQLYCTMSKLMSNISLLNDVKHSDLKPLVKFLRKYHKNPIDNVSNIFKLISNIDSVAKSELMSLIKFNETDFNVIKSVYEFVFSYDENMDKIKYKDLKNKNIKAIEFNNLKTRYSFGKYSVSNDVASVLNDFMDASYIFTEYDYDGNVSTTIRNKYRDRRLQEKLKDNINLNVITSSINLRSQLSEEFVLLTGENPKSTDNVEVIISLTVNDKKIPLSFIVKNTQSGASILAQSTSVILEENKNQEMYNITLSKIREIFNTIDLSDVTVRQRLLKDNNEGLSEDEQIFKQMLSILDNRLQTSFLSDEGLLKLDVFRLLNERQGEQNYIDNLLLYSTKVQLTSDIYHKFENDKLNNTNLSDRNFRKWLNNNYYWFSNITDETVYFQSIEGFKYLKAIPQSTQWFNILEEATLYLTGGETASVSKNQNNNNDANYVTSFLGGQLEYIIDKSKEAQSKKSEETPDLASSFLLTSSHTRLFKKVVINSDVKNRQGTVKSIRELNVSELFYNDIIHNFWTSYINIGQYCIQPTTYSDKVKIINVMVDGKVGIFNRKNLHSLSKIELIQLYSDTIGKSAEASLKNVLYDYSKVFEQENMTAEQVSKILKITTLQELIQKFQSKGLELQEDLHYKTKKVNGRKILVFNEVLTNYSRYTDINYTIQRFKEEEVSFINDLINSNTSFFVDYYDTSIKNIKTFNKLTVKEQLQISKSPIAKIILNTYSSNEEIEQYFKKWIKNGQLILAKDEIGKDVTYQNVTGVSEINPLLEKYFYINSLVANNLRIQYTGFEFNHPDKSFYTKSKIWDNVAKQNGIVNPLLNSSNNIKRIQKANVIWGHPALGKTTYLNNNPDRIIEWDNEFNEIRNSFIKERNLDKEQFLIGFQNYIQGNIDETTKEIFEEFKNIVTLNWENAKAKANQENKKLFASPTMLPLLFPEDFDIYLTINKNEFLRRKPGEEAWKDSIDLILSNHQNKVIDIGNLYMSDVMALNDGFDLFEMSLSQNKEVQLMAQKVTQIIENVIQGTQLKRNVIIPGNMHYVYNASLGSIYRRTKVAVIEDMEATVNNYEGDKKTIDAMDGGAFTCMYQSILENIGLGSQEVGLDKKPLWHHYNDATCSAALMKLASYAITNERMRLSANSTVPLVRMHKKMTNLQWQKLDENGNGTGEWNTTDPIDLCNVLRPTGQKIIKGKLQFEKEILQGNSLYYKSYDSDGDVVYKRIIDFEYDKDKKAYYTTEVYYNEFGEIDLYHEGKEKVYHYFNNSEHISVTDDQQIPKNCHTINSLYELWLAMGGYSSGNFENYEFSYTEASNYTVVEFMNRIMVHIPNSNKYNFSQDSYRQPLKQMMIGYLTNKTTMKEGAANINSRSKWFEDDSSLTYMEMDSDGLGIQMDADHDVEIASEMTEFSQVISALESGGRLHKYAKQVYKALQKVAVTSSKLELDTVANFIDAENKEEVKSELYDLIGRILINGIKNNQISLTDNIMDAISKRFNKNINHLQDLFKIPFSDSNIYGQILPTLVSLINKKSIKRKFTGSGSVIVPSYNVIQYFQIGDYKYTFDDVLKLALNDETIDKPTDIKDVALYEKTLVQNYLKKVQEEQEFESVIEGFIPSDIIDIQFTDGTIKTVRLDTIDDYYNFLDKNWEYFKINKEISGFRFNVTQPKNLAPSRITFKVDGKLKSIFELKVYRDAYNQKTLANSKAVQKTFNNLSKGFYEENGEIIKITDLQNKPAELIGSDLYSSIFKTKGHTVSEIKKQGPEFFKKRFIPFRGACDVAFTRNNGEQLLLSFKYPKNAKYEAYNKNKLRTEKDQMGNIEVFLMSNDNRKLFKVGRYVLESEYHVVDGKILDSSNRQLSSKEIKKLKVDGDKIYKYIEFVSKYKVTQKVESEGVIESLKQFDVYYINFKALSEIKEKQFKESGSAYKKFVTNILSGIYGSDQFLDIKVNSELTTSSAQNIFTYLFNINNIDLTFRKEVINPLETLIRNKVNDINKDEKIKDSKKDKIITIVPQEINDIYNNYYDILSKQIYSSWEQSLYFTSARIPAQNLQSFMQMENVAYSGNFKNIAYVSAIQTWLQGSKINKN